MFETVNIGNRRELFWDDFLIDTTRTTAELKLHTLQPRDVAVNHDERRRYLLLPVQVTPQLCQV